MISEEAVWEHLKELKDTMFGEPLSIVDAGLVCEIEVSGSAVYVAIIMFNRGRIYMDAAASPIRQHLLRMEGVDEVTVECLWESEWTPDRLSRTARYALGFLADDPVEGRMHVRSRKKARPDAEPVDERRLERKRLDLGRAAREVTDLPRGKFGRWWGGWRFFKRFGVEENAGLPRRSEPVHLDVVFVADQVGDMAREVRLVDEAAAEEIPCQVYGQATDGATKRCSIVFLANIEASRRKGYLLLHGNASPACWPPFYPTDLVTRGEGYALQIENSFYGARLSPVMGQLRNLVFKRWGRTGLGWEEPSPINRIDAANDPKSELDIAWHGEDRCIHWNPDFRNQLRYRMTNWPEVPHYRVVEGPICTVVERWGYPVCPTHPARAQQAVRLEVTYAFYRGLPYFTMESRLRVEAEADVLVVRNDEWLFRQAFTHSLRMAEGEEIMEAPADEAVSFEQNPALVGFFNEGSGDAFASLRLAFDARGFPGAYDPGHLSLGTTAHGNQLWSRDVFHAGEANAAIQPGAAAGEYNAYLCYNLREGGGHRQAADWYGLLRQPLSVSTDE